MILDDLTCASARERLSARLDGELDEARALEAHLGRCAPCRTHERELARLARGFAALRAEPVGSTDLWPAIERRARPRAAGPLLARVAAALLGFLGVGAAARWLAPGDGEPAARHLLEHLARGERAGALLADLPEYRVLRAFPPVEETR
ncbi:MAG TPA: zf-HC2 domain-containing protein [Planctomycetota bacterium]